MELELILIELQPFNLSHFWQLFCSAGYGVYVINSSYSFNDCFSNFAGIYWGYLRGACGFFDIARINFDRITAF